MLLKTLKSNRLLLLSIFMVFQKETNCIVGILKCKYIYKNENFMLIHGGFIIGFVFLALNNFLKPKIFKVV